MVEFRFCLGSGCWHGDHKGQTYTVHPDDWRRLPWRQGAQGRLLEPEDLALPAVQRGHTRIPLSAPRSPRRSVVGSIPSADGE